MKILVDRYILIVLVNTLLLVGFTIIKTNVNFRIILEGL